MLHRTVVGWVLAVSVCLLLGETGAVPGDQVVSANQESPQAAMPPELFSKCSLARGEEYLAAREALLRVEELAFFESLKRLAEGDDTSCAERLTASIILTRRESPEEWGAFDTDLAAMIDRSHATVTGRPSIRAISGFMPSIRKQARGRWCED